MEFGPLAGPWEPYLGRRRRGFFVFRYAAPGGRNQTLWEGNGVTGLVSFPRFTSD